MMHHLARIGTLLGLAVLALLVVVFVAYVVSPTPVVPLTVEDDDTLLARKIAGVRLHLETHGDAEAPFIVVLHGGPGGDYRSLMGLADLADDYRLVFYDQRGAGLSARVDPALLDLDGYLSELDAIITAHSPDRPVHLVGHSWGAMLATAYLGVAPDNVASAVLIEPGYFDAVEFADWQETAQTMMSGPNWWWEIGRAVIEAAHLDESDPRAAEDHVSGRMAHTFTNHPDNPYHCPDQSYDAPYWRFGATASRWAAEWPDEQVNRIAEGAGGYTGPVLLLAGGCNTWIGEPLQSRHQAAFANARLQVIPGAGHEVVWDNPRPALQAIRAHLDGQNLKQ